MRFPSQCLQAVSIYHLPTTGGATQAYPGTADAVTTGAVLPLERRALALEGGDLNEPWEVYLDPTIDIRLNDKVTISGDSGKNYYVANIFSAQFGELTHKRVVISKQP